MVYARVLTDAVSLSVLRLLAANPHLSQRELASSVGVSLGKVNYCLRALIAKGLVKAENYRKSSNKLAYLYLLTPAGVAARADLTKRFLARKVKEYEALRKEIEYLERESDWTAGTA
jgi:EPS-associated MarR family transcriptional regulator